MNYRVNEVPYKQARRAYARLLRNHSDERADRDAFEVAGAAFEPGMFACADGALEERLLIEVADAYGLDPVIFDDVMYESVNQETDLMLQSLRHRDFVESQEK